MNANEMSNDGYLLLFSGKEWWKAMDRAELEQSIAQNKAWFKGLITSGKFKTGKALARSGAIVSGKGGSSVKDGPFAESKEVVGGYVLVSVATLEEAVAIAKTAPCLAYGGSVEVRPLTNECASDKRLEELMGEEQLVAA